MKTKQKRKMLEQSGVRKSADNLDEFEMDCNSDVSGSEGDKDSSEDEDSLQNQRVI